jgi:hypothetical protein
MLAYQITQDHVSTKIFLIRSQKVLLDRDLAKLYGVTTGNLNKAVKRNIGRFPADFMFQLTKDETASLRFQFGSLKKGSHSKYLPHAFTEQGVAMLSGVLNSERAVEVNIIIMRTFVKIREILMNHKELALKLNDLERKNDKHEKEIRIIFETIRQLMQPPETPKRKIGFHAE